MKLCLYVLLPVLICCPQPPAQRLLDFCCWSEELLGLAPLCLCPAQLLLASPCLREVPLVLESGSQLWKVEFKCYKIPFLSFFLVSTLFDCTSTTTQIILFVIQLWYNNMLHSVSVMPGNVYSAFHASPHVAEGFYINVWHGKPAMFCKIGRKSNTCSW